MCHQDIPNNNFDPVEDSLLHFWGEVEVDIGRLDGWFIAAELHMIMIMIMIMISGIWNYLNT